jgi:hypothetical protein
MQKSAQKNCSIHARPLSTSPPQFHCVKHLFLPLSLTISSIYLFAMSPPCPRLCLHLPLSYPFSISLPHFIFPLSLSLSSGPPAHFLTFLVPRQGVSMSPSQWLLVLVSLFCPPPLVSVFRLFSRFLNSFSSSPFFPVSLLLSTGPCLPFSLFPSLPPSPHLKLQLHPLSIIPSLSPFQVRSVPSSLRPSQVPLPAYNLSLSLPSLSFPVVSLCIFAWSLNLLFPIPISSSLSPFLHLSPKPVPPTSLFQSVSFPLVPYFQLFSCLCLPFSFSVCFPLVPSHLLFLCLSALAPFPLLFFNLPLLFFSFPC